MVSKDSEGGNRGIFNVSSRN